MSRLHAGEELAEVLDDISGHQDMRSSQVRPQLLSPHSLCIPLCFYLALWLSFFVSPSPVPSLTALLPLSQGMMGLITNGTLPRGACYEHGVIFALSPFVSPQQYWDKEVADRVSTKGQTNAQTQP